MNTQARTYLQLLRLLLLPLIMLSSCKINKEYDEMVPLPAIAEMAPRSAQETAERQKLLEEIYNQPYPEYRINPGDVYRVSVYGYLDLETKDVMVSPDGELSVTLLGPVKIGGMTLKEATAELERCYQHYIKYPKVAMFMISIASQSATIAGKVNNAGLYPVSKGFRLRDLLASARGTPTELFNGQGFEVADFSTSIYIRGDRVLPIDFDRAFQTGDPLHNIEVHPGDYVYISSRADKLVSVLGEVHLPCFIVWYENMGLIEAITNARGLKEEYYHDAVVIRRGVEGINFYKVNVDGIFRGTVANASLLPGDIIYVPKDKMSAYNVFVRKLMPTAQLLNALLSPVIWMDNR
ncbi:MAG: polysaccharide export protein [Lentisphaeria bacterium]|nr:polysaccharide export protein [Lentisphaeria bacterium]